MRRITIITLLLFASTAHAIEPSFRPVNGTMTATPAQTWEPMHYAPAVPAVPAVQPVPQAVVQVPRVVYWRRWR